MLAARTAVQLSKQVHAELVISSIAKDDHSPVTVADFAVQALVAGLLADTFPKDPLVAEEDAALLRSPLHTAELEQVCSFVGRFLPRPTPEATCALIDYGAADPERRFWTLDPIDGTKGFLRYGQYAVALALVVDGMVQVAVLGCPNLGAGCLPQVGGPGSLVVAARGQGAWRIRADAVGGYERLRVSTCQNPTEARVLRSFDPEHTNVDEVDRFARALGVEPEPVLMDSQAKYAVLAAGRGDLLLRLLSPTQPGYRECIWDQAAGSLVVAEAGGCVTDLDGMALAFDRGRRLTRNRGVLASNGGLHSRALAALARQGSPARDSSLMASYAAYERTYRL